MTDIIATTIAALEDERYAAMLAADADVLNRLLHKDMVYMHSSGFADSKSSYLDKLRSQEFLYRKIRWAEQQVTVNGNVALVFHELHLDVDVRGVNKKMSNRALAVWSFEDERWQLLGVQSGPMPGSPAMTPVAESPTGKERS